MSIYGNQVKGCIARAGCPAEEVIAVKHSHSVEAKEKQSHKRLPMSIQKQALDRQELRCASCGEHIPALGASGRHSHRFGEGAEGHHIIPHKLGGPVSLENCVVLCRACHLNAHQGGQWSDTSIYDDILELPMSEQIATIAAEYPHYHG
jgi:hypothetical protein